MTNQTALEFISLVKTMADMLDKRHWKLAAVESCTGGWLSKICTDQPGSSVWFECGFITYSNQSKQDLVNVSKTTLAKYGAVSEQTAIEMAQGAIANSSADISVAITGIAGPDGGTIENQLAPFALLGLLEIKVPKHKNASLKVIENKFEFKLLLPLCKGSLKTLETDLHLWDNHVF